MDIIYSKRYNGVIMVGGFADVTEARAEAASVRCGNGREFKSGPAKPVAMVDSRSGLAGALNRDDPEGQ